MKKSYKRNKNKFEKEEQDKEQARAQKEQVQRELEEKRRKKQEEKERLRNEQRLDSLRRTLEKSIQEEDRREIELQQQQIESLEKERLQKIQESISMEKELQSAQVQVYFEESLLAYKRREQADDLAKRIAQQLRNEILAERRKLELEREAYSPREKPRTKEERANRELQRIEDYTQIRSELSRQINEDKYQLQQEDIVIELQKEKQYALQRIAELTKINQDSVFQQTWYKFTDSISQSTPNLASRLDVYKENIEDYIISKRVFAYRERERQVRERLISIERSRIEQQEERLRRLTKLYEREQIKSEQSDQREGDPASSTIRK